MDRSTSVPMGMGEQSLTPGEQRILALLQQGQQRLEQRLDGMDQRLLWLEEGQKRADQHIKELTLKVDEEATASKVRDLKLAMEVEGFRQAGRKLIPWIQGVADRIQRETHAVVQLEMDSLRGVLSMRLDLHDTHLVVVKQTLERHDDHLREQGQSIEGLQHEVRKLTATVEHQAQAPRAAASP